MDELQEMIEESTRLNPEFPHLMEEARTRVTARRVFSRSDVRFGSTQASASTIGNARAATMERIDVGASTGR